MQRPIALKKIDERTLGITWSDRHESLYDTTTLREQCTCAACQDEWTGERKIMPGSLPQTIRPVQMDSVGEYGLKIIWSDRHAAGIYTYDYLRKLCQCSHCQKKTIGSIF